MEKIRELLAKPTVSLFLGLFVGLIIGWFGIGWGVWPVEWKDASAKDLRSDLRMDYLRMAVESYAQTPNDGAAKRRWAELGDLGLGTFKALQSEPSVDPAKMDVFRQVIGIGNGDLQKTPGKSSLSTVSSGQGQTPAVSNTTSALSTVSTPTPAGEVGESASPGINLIYLLIILVVLTVVIGLMLFFFIFIKPRLSTDSSGQPSEKTAPVIAGSNYQYATDDQGEPIAQFMTAYALGDDLYDDSFSIDSPNGEFLGECGVGVSDTIGAGDPKKISAFEVWLFDKNDIQTVTKVLMSDHAYNDPDTSQRLAAKGEPVLVSPGKSIILETATLQMEARVVDINYGQGSLPYGSFFERLTLELAIWPKNLG